MRELLMTELSCVIMNMVDGRFQASPLYSSPLTLASKRSKKSKEGMQIRVIDETVHVFY